MPDGLPAEWKKRADYLRRFGDPACARLWELAASELETGLAAHGQETLTLVQAARESGYTADRLGQLVKPDGYQTLVVMVLQGSVEAISR